MNANTHELHNAYIVAIEAMNYERTQLQFLIDGAEHYKTETRVTHAEVNTYAQREHQLTQAMTVLAEHLPRELVAAELARLERDIAEQ